jgi:hypothetical protein
MLFNLFITFYHILSHAIRAHSNVTPGRNISDSIFRHFDPGFHLRFTFFAILRLKWRRGFRVCPTASAICPPRPLSYERSFGQILPKPKHKVLRLLKAAPTHIGRCLWWPTWPLKRPKGDKIGQFWSKKSCKIVCQFWSKKSYKM